MITSHKTFVSIFLIFLLSFFIFITGCGGGGGSDVSLPPTTGDTPTGDTSDTTPPEVLSFSPTGTGVVINSAVTATFSEAMDPLTIDTTTFTVSTGGGNISGTVAYSNTTATFTPSTDLASSTSYAATIAAGVKDLAGNQMKSSYSWSFETGTTSDATAPTDPAGLTATAVSSSQINLSWTTSTDSGVAGLAGYTIERCNGAGCANFTQTTTTTLTIYSDTGLTASTSYSYRVRAYDNAGNNSGYSNTASTTTSGPPDTTAPTVLSSSISPSNGATNVSVNTQITATFSETMDGTTFTSSTFTLTSGAGAVSGIVSYAGTTAVFTPSSSLSYGTTYTATITTGVKDLAGNQMASNYTWTFTTTVSGTASLTWDANSELDLVGYRVYYGTSPGVYIQVKGEGIYAGNNTAYTAINLQVGILYYFAVTAYDTSGNESDYSDEVSKTIE